MRNVSKLKRRKELKKKVVLNILFSLIFLLIVGNCSIFANAKNPKTINPTVIEVEDNKVENNKTIKKEVIQPLQKKEIKTTKELLLEKMSKKELFYISHCVEVEAEGEGLKGKIAVANVLINRKNSNKFPNSFEGIVKQRNQFSSYSSPKFKGKKVTSETFEAINLALNGKNLVGNATYFCNLELCKGSWFTRATTIKKVTKINHHTFFALKE